MVREIRASEKDGKPDVKNYGHAYLPIVDEMRQEALEAAKLLQDEDSAIESKYIGGVDARHTLFMLRIEDDKYALKVPLFYRKPERDGPVTISLKESQVHVDYSPQICDDIRRIVKGNVNTSTGKLINNG